jgi:hypothetical protein
MNIRLLLIVVLFPFMASAQNPCKVLLPALDSVYAGGCKNGLAHGAGEAWGRFHYTGRFVAGYPQGQGRAEYPDGSVYDGAWKKGMRNGKGTFSFMEKGQPVEKVYSWDNDTIRSEIKPPPYKVITQRNISRLRVFRQGEGNSVWFYPNSTGGVATDLVDVQLIGSSGKELNINPKLGYEEVTFPFRGSIRYKAWNQLRTTQFEILLEIEVSEPGNWVVEIQN